MPFLFMGTRDEKEPKKRRTTLRSGQIETDSRLSADGVGDL